MKVPIQVFLILICLRERHLCPYTLFIAPSPRQCRLCRLPKQCIRLRNKLHFKRDMFWKIMIRTYFQCPVHCAGVPNVMCVTEQVCPQRAQCAHASVCPDGQTIIHWQCSAKTSIVLDLQPWWLFHCPQLCPQLCPALGGALPTKTCCTRREMVIFLRPANDHPPLPWPAALQVVRFTLDKDPSFWFSSHPFNFYKDLSFWLIHFWNLVPSVSRVICEIGKILPKHNF